MQESIPLLADTLCTTRCMRRAELMIDGEPFCIDCADAWLERLQAVELRPELAELLPPLFREGRVIVPRGLPDPEPDETKLEELRRQWATWQAQVAPQERCIALTPAGQCIRKRVSGERLCETHYAARYGQLPSL